MDRYFNKWCVGWAALAVFGSVVAGLAQDLLTIPITWMGSGLIVMSWGVLWLGIAVGAIAFFVSAVFMSKGRQRSFFTSLLMLSALLLSSFLLKWSSNQHLYFAIHEDLYNEAAELIMRGEYERNERNIILPEKYDALSSGIIWSYQREGALDILFCHAGLAGELSGYVFSSDGKPPMPGTTSRVIRHSNGHWFDGANDGCLVLPDGLE